MAQKKMLPIVLGALGIFLAGVASGWAANTEYILTGQLMLSFDRKYSVGFIVGFGDMLNEVRGLLVTEANVHSTDEVITNMKITLDRMNSCLESHGPKISNIETWAETIWRAHPDELAADALANACL